MTNEEYILDWYKNHIWTRPYLSKVCDGVGMVAIRDIPKGTNIYEFPDREVNIKVLQEKIKDFPSGVINWLIDFQPINSLSCKSNFNWKEVCSEFWLYTTKKLMFMGILNFKTVWFFQNHSEDGNINIEGNDKSNLKIVSNRLIKKGEEILENYNETAITSQWVQVL